MQSVAKCHILRYDDIMAKSIRISDGLYAAAEASSGKMRRSLAQQVEYWAELGRALEQAGVTSAQAAAILDGDLRSRERMMLKLGLATPESMHFIPAHTARQAKVRFPELYDDKVLDD